MAHYVCTHCSGTAVTDVTHLDGTPHDHCREGAGTWIKMPDPCTTHEQETELLVRAAWDLVRVVRPDLAEREGLTRRELLPTTDAVWRNFVWHLACVSEWIDAGHREPWE